MVAPGGEALGGVIGVARHMIQTEGFFSLYKGLVPSLISMAPSGAVFYGVYDILKMAYLHSPEGKKRVSMMKQQKQETNALDQLELGTVRTLLYGAIAGCCAEAATYPFEVVRRQLQMQVKATRMNALATCLKIVDQGGVPALYAGIIPSLLQVKGSNTASSSGNMTLQAPSTPPSPCPPPPSSDQISTHHGTFQREVVGAEVARLVGGEGSVEQWDAARRSTHGGVSRGASRTSRRDGRGRGSIVRLAARITGKTDAVGDPEDSAWSGPRFRLGYLVLQCPRALRRLGTLGDKRVGCRRRFPVCKMILFHMASKNEAALSMRDGSGGSFNGAVQSGEQHKAKV
ncbi:putative mitochondrial adenine nucleotide transporter BTL3 [Zea mays]|uniref:Putative mitochondrial adenine nucleotide transporter BTL3 n=1 Tax=Zea mays TaxID=4577 RepID=A0A3L6EGC5_MAIZE|nr:putative mitochondrial adenine nucleotide transporter BTL3 [Zea mays]